MRIVFLHGRWDEAGRFRRWAGLAPSARHAEMAAVVAAAGHDTVLVYEPDVRDADGATRAVDRYEPDAVVVSADTVPAELIAAVDRAGGIPVVVTTSSDDAATVLAELGVAVGPGTEALAPAVTGVLRPSLAAIAGVEVAYSRADGMVVRHPVERIVAGLHALTETDGSVELVGFSMLAQTEALELMAAAAATGVRLSVTVGPDLDVDALRDVLATAGACGGVLSVHAVLGDDLDMAEELADTVLATGTELTFTWTPDVSEEVALMGESILRSAAPQTLAAAERIGPKPALVTVVAGRPDPGERPAGLDVLLVTSESPAPVAAVGCATDVFAIRPQHPSIGGRAWRFAVGGLAEPGPASVGGVRFTVAPYHTGRHDDPLEPTMLTFEEAADIDAFLADADAARCTGRFPRALRSPFTLLADECAFAGPGRCASHQVRRAVLTPDGLRASRFGPVIGGPQDPHGVLVRRARVAARSAMDERGCATCPVASVCSKDLCLSTLVGGERYCAERRARPWLAAYIDALDALRVLPAKAWSEPARVAGFGGQLQASDIDGSWPQRPPVVLLEHEGTYYGWAPGRTAPLRMSPASSAIAELALLTDDPAERAERVATHFGLPLARAAEAVTTVRKLLCGHGVALPARPADMAVA
jgi:hypothetical protein